MLPSLSRWTGVRWTRWFFLALSVTLLGYVGFSLLDAQLFQAYENWRLDHTVHASAVPSGSPPVRAASTSSVTALHARVTPGSTLGRLEIGRIGVATIVVEGTDGRSLRRAVGHITGTALPGEKGNLAIAGHRDTFFRGLRNIRQDDEITLTTVDGSYRYRVDWMKVVGPQDFAVLNDSGDDAVLTLVTCYPFYFVGAAPERFIVRAHREP
jgi:sortase A